MGKKKSAVVSWEQRKREALKALLEAREAYDEAWEAYQSGLILLPQKEEALKAFIKARKAYAEACDEKRKAYAEGVQ